MARKLVRTTIAVASVIAGGVVTLAGAAPASATPTNCLLTEASHSASAVCSSGTGEYRVVGTCQDPQRLTERTYYGAWVTAGKTSVINCETIGGITWFLISARIGKR